MQSNYREAEAIAAKIKAERLLAENEAKTAKLIDTLEANLIISAMNVNDNAEKKDTNRNHVNSGVCINLQLVLGLLGQEVEMPCYGDGDYLKIPSVTINGRKTIYHNG